MSNDLKRLRDRIEGMSKYHQTEVLRILTHIENVSVNENSNGCFINLTELEDSVRSKLFKYVTYVDQQEHQLTTVETEKDRIQNVFFNGNKDSDNIRIS
jgi:hypothetical protein|tara:strand:+ start:3172 stop:3468 length:297 start_codon:yes stop_codon:yes gene_type:complete